MEFLTDIEFFCSDESPSHFLESEEEGEAGIEPSCDCGIAAPVFGGKDGRGPLPGAEAIELLAAVVAQRLAAGVNGAAEVAGKVMAGLAGGLVVPELAAAVEGEGGAAQRKAFAAVGGEVGFHFRVSGCAKSRVCPGYDGLEKAKAPVLSNRGFVQF